MGGIPAEQPTGLIGWVLENGQIVAFFAQIAYWLLLVVLLAYAVWQYKRWVNFQLGTGRSGQLRADGDDVATDSKRAVSVEEFIE